MLLFLQTLRTFTGLFLFVLVHQVSKELPTGGNFVERQVELMSDEVQSLRSGHRTRNTCKTVLEVRNGTVRVLEDVVIISSLLAYVALAAMIATLSEGVTKKLLPNNMLRS